MKFHQSKDVRIIMPPAALTEVFDECDRFPHDETGGRVIGTFDESDGALTLRILGIIEPGPKARRSPVEFHQDGEHQEKVFRNIESRHPEVEHLGNWHTHHMNGLTHLSGGDIRTYTRIVEHPKQHTPFFYALLVVSKLGNGNPLRRYSTKHYILRRGDDRVFEIPEDCVEIVEAPLVWPDGKTEGAAGAAHAGYEKFHARPERAHDREHITTFYPELRALSSKKLGIYWRGPVELVDGSRVEVVLLEGNEAEKPTYTVTLRKAPRELQAAAERLQGDAFKTARAALTATERQCNRAIWDYHQHQAKP
jgi:hypothetical protein